MKKIDLDILKKNIRKILNDKGISQEKLGEAIDMTQSNVNKCLKIGDGSRNFSSEQLWKIADFFNTSIDELMGRIDNKMNEKEISDEDFCRHLMSLIQDQRIKYIEHTASEDIWDFDEFRSYSGEQVELEWRKRNKKYFAFYFQDYIQIPYCENEIDYQAYLAEYSQCGNDCRKNIVINKFLEKFVDAHFHNKKGIYSDEIYKIVVKSYWDEFIKNMENPD